MENAYGLIITGMGALSLLFISRFVRRMDEFKDETRDNFKLERKERADSEKRIMDRIDSISNVTIDKQARTKLQLLEESMSENKIDFGKRIASVEKQQKEDHGIVTWLKAGKDANDKMIKSVYNKIVLKK